MMRNETAQDRHYLREMENAIARAAYERVRGDVGITGPPAVAMVGMAEGHEFVDAHWPFFVRNHVTVIDEWCWS